MSFNSRIHDMEIDDIPWGWIGTVIMSVGGAVMATGRWVANTIHGNYEKVFESYERTIKGMETEQSDLKETCSKQQGDIDELRAKHEECERKNTDIQVRLARIEPRVGIRDDDKSQN